VTNLLRNELGFSGLIVTDSHQMSTIANVYGSGDSAVMAIQAGVDIVLMPYDLGAAVDGVCNAVKNGTISESRIDESVNRILSKKSQLGLL
jgi:beta-N-acetylhexosaminidase